MMNTQVTKDLAPAASLPLQKLLYFDFYFSVLYFALEYLFYILKGPILFYPKGIIAVEIVKLTIFLVTQFVRLHFGSHGNKTESSGAIMKFVILTVFSILGFIFYLRLQIYVIKAEVLINSIGLAFAVLELLFAIFAQKSFKEIERNQ